MGEVYRTRTELQACKKKLDEKSAALEATRLALEKSNVENEKLRARVAELEESVDRSPKHYLAKLTKMEAWLAKKHITLEQLRTNIRITRKQLRTAEERNVRLEEERREFYGLTGFMDDGMEPRRYK